MRKFILTAVWVTALTSAATASAAIPPAGFRAQEQVKTIGQPFDYTEQVRQEKKAPILKESVSHPDYIITQPEGELKNYVRRGTAITSYLGGTQEVSQDGMTMKVVFAEDGKTVWFYELVSTAEYCFGWIRGEREGNQITIPGGQYAWFYDYGDYYTAYTVTPIKENPEGEIGGYDWYQSVEGDIVFTIDDSDRLTLVPAEGTCGIGLCRETTDPYLVENGYDGKWLGYADLTTEYIPIDIKFNEAPAEYILRESYYMNYETSVITGNSGNQMITVAVDGNKMYIQGLMKSTLPESWLIGEIDGDKVNFSSGQMVGIMDRRYVYYVGVKVYDDMSWEILPTFTMAYNKETGNLSFPDWILLNAFPDNELLYGDGLFDIDMHPFNDIPVIPANPIIGNEYLPYDEMIQSMLVSFTIVPTGSNGEEIDPSQLSYEVFIDEELFTFEPDTYYTFIEPVTLIPYGFYDGYFFMQSYMEDNTVLIRFFDPDYKSFGARSVYFGGNERRESEIITFTPENTGIGMTKTNHSTPVETLYFDMMGRRIEQPGKGVVVEVKRFDDGTTISRKITVR